MSVRTVVVLCFSLLSVFVLGCYLLLDAKLTPLPEQRFTIQTEQGDLPLDLLISQNWHSRFQGLSGRSHLDDHDGMIFLYEKPQHVTFVMRNMKFVLDFAFVGKNGEISQMVRNVDASYNGNIKSDYPVIAVIEIPSSKQLFEFVRIGSIVNYASEKPTANIKHPIVRNW